MIVTLANFTHPALALLIGLWAAPIIGGGIFIEAWIARRKFEFSWRKTLLAVLVVNVCSALLSAPVASVGLFSFEYLEMKLDFELQWGDRYLSGLPSFVAAYFITTLINAAFEGWLLVKIWKVPAERHPYRRWIVANAISNGLVFAAVAVFAMTR